MSLVKYFALSWEWDNHSKSSSKSHSTNHHCNSHYYEQEAVNSHYYEQEADTSSQAQVSLVGFQPFFTAEWVNWPLAFAVRLKQPQTPSSRDTLALMAFVVWIWSETRLIGRVSSPAWKCYWQVCVWPFCDGPIPRTVLNCVFTPQVFEVWSSSLKINVWRVKFTP